MAELLPQKGAIREQLGSHLIGNCMKMGAIMELTIPRFWLFVCLTVVGRIFQLFGVILYTTLEIGILPGLPCLGRT